MVKYRFYGRLIFAKRTLSVREVWGSIPGPVKSAQCRQRLATVATFLRSCVAQALSRGDGPRNSLHASAYYGEYNEDLIFFDLNKFDFGVSCIFHAADFFMATMKEIRRDLGIFIMWC